MDIAALFNNDEVSTTRVTNVTAICANKFISAYVITPEQAVTRAPLIAIHGISRNAEEILEQFRPEAAATPRVIIVPTFDQDTWPVFQRITNRHRPDLALLAVLNTLRERQVINRQRVDLFGFSGGAQLAHRFAMLFPELVDELHLGAAGWYTLPQPNLPYPLGVGVSSSKNNWHRLMQSSLLRFLNRRIQVYVGKDDVSQDQALRQDSLLNRVQGDTRVERAERYVDLVGREQARIGFPFKAQLRLLENCAHDFKQCCTEGGMIEMMRTAQ